MLDFWGETNDSDPLHRLELLENKIKKLEKQFSGIYLLLKLFQTFGLIFQFVKAI
jgi:hypothetical protein